MPRVRCECGNPLLPPNGTGDTYTSMAWASFQANDVVTVQPAAAPVTQMVLVNQARGSQFDWPVGGTGNSDSSATPGESGSGPYTSQPGSASPFGPSSPGGQSGMPSGASGSSGNNSSGAGPGSEPTSPYAGAGTSG
ncbi:DUF6777 domain-containing protein [Kitasatospora sp. NPDC004622]|uniref:DUF6777 domain-containing protein n=1 Tax=Kitasatospora sp. NPDC004622 TaxID=3364018 RepID=UPI00367773C8